MSFNSLTPLTGAESARRRGTGAAFWFAFVSMGVLATQAAAAGAPAGAPLPVAVTGNASSDAGASTDGASALQEVIVTARKREEDLKSIPLSVTALSGAAVAVKRINDLEDLSRAAPGISFNSGAMEGTNNISIRGVSSTAGSATVGTYIDDVSITIPNLFYEGNAEPRLPDLDRIEVLRGPQGTLYGDSSEGGTIRYISQSPNMSTYTADLTADVSGTEHGGVNGGLTANVSIPLVPDKIALRIAANGSYDSGWIDHFTQNLVDFAPVGGGTKDQRGVNWDYIGTVHITAKFTPNDDLTIIPGFYYQRFHANDSSAFYIGVPGLGLYDQDKLVQEPDTDSLTLASLDIRENLGWADLTAVTGYFERGHSRIEDGTFFNSTVFAFDFLATLPGACPGPCAPLPNPVNPAIDPQGALNIISNTPSKVRLDASTQQLTQEIRLSSPDKGPDQRLHWVAGIYYANQRIHETDFQQIENLNAEFLGLYGETLEQSSAEVAFNGGIPNTVLFPDNIDESDNRYYYNTQYAAFGQIDWDFLPTWHLGVGGRYEYATEHFDATELGFYQIGNITPYHQAQSANSFTPKFTLSHDFSRDESVYASAGEGFRLGGPTGPIVFGPQTVCSQDFAAINQTTQPAQFGSDTLWTYEAGSKGAYFGGRLSVNAAGFYTSWHNIQQQIYLPICGYYFTENAGDAEIYGGEIEANFKLTHALSIDASGSANSATITRSINPVDIPVGSNLIDVPVGTFTVGATYDAPLTGDIDILGRIDYDFTGDSYGSYTKINPVGSPNLNYRNPSYGVLNASVALTRGKYQLSLYAKNLLNDQTLIQTPEVNTVYEGYTVHPRVVGLTFNAHF
jgi:outer membrane receptor protein involved in Fe transport